jgi:AraC family transcriptional regulator, activator of mtrCDE
MDILDDVLDTLDLKGSLYFRTDFSAPWATTVPVLGAAARFHLVVQGQCTVTLPGCEPTTLHPGDLVLIPHGQTHILSDAPVESAPPLETVLEHCGYDGNGVLVVGEGDKNANTQLVCGHFTFREKADHALLRTLPDHFIITSSMRAQYPLLDEVLRMMSRQIFTDRTGLASSVRRLSEVMFIELMRIGIEDDTQNRINLSLKGFRDPKIAQALSLMHTELAAPWTVNSLAREVGMSRSSFADRFAELMQQGPMSYLSDWRLQKALSLLEKRNESVQQVASQTGYQSPAAFTRAFAAKFGETPSQYRQNAS